LAACPDDQVRNGELAVQAARWSWNLAPVGSPPDMKVLAAAFAETGDFKRAISLQEKAVGAFQDEARALEEDVLETYRAGKPYRFSVGD
jgi:serine/threonine-protein kinase